MAPLSLFPEKIDTYLFDGHRQQPLPFFFGAWVDDQPLVALLLLSEGFPLSVPRNFSLFVPPEKTFHFVLNRLACPRRCFASNCHLFDFLSL